jgi:hypothetical protein
LTAKTAKSTNTGSRQKSSAKPSAKTASSKAAASTSGKQGIARSVGPEYYFFVVDGRPLKNLLELADSMEEMTEEAFKHHVTETKNDFAKWVHDVFGDEELAIKLGQSKTKHHHQLVILKHLVRRLLP